MEKLDKQATHVLGRMEQDHERLDEVLRMVCKFKLTNCSLLSFSAEYSQTAVDLWMNEIPRTYSQTKGLGNYCNQSSKCGSPHKSIPQKFTILHFNPSLKSSFEKFQLRI